MGAIEKCTVCIRWVCVAERMTGPPAQCKLVPEDLYGRSSPGCCSAHRVKPKASALEAECMGAGSAVWLACCVLCSLMLSVTALLVEQMESVWGWDVSVELLQM